MAKPAELEQGTLATPVNPDNWNAFVDRINALADKIYDPMVHEPSSTQVIDAAADAILADATAVILDPDADHTLTSTPTIADGDTGQILYITCGGAEGHTVTIQDQDTLGGSNLQLRAATRAVTGKVVLKLFFDGSDWIEVGFGVQYLMDQNVSTVDDVVFAGITTGDLVCTPSAAQVINAAGDAILADAAMVVLNPDANYTLTSTPTIADGTTGQIVIITCASGETKSVTLQDQDTLGASNLQLNSAMRTITANSRLVMGFNGTDWEEQSYALDGSGDKINVKWFGATGDGATNDYAAILAAHTYATISGGTVFFPSGNANNAYRIDTSITFNADTVIDIAPGATLKPNSGVAITINGGLVATPQQIFDVSLGGSIVFGSEGYVKSVLAQWWGAIGDNSTECSDAFNLALTAAREVGMLYIPAGVYRLSTPILNFPSQNWYSHTGGPVVAGAGMEDTIMNFRGTEGFAFELEKQGTAAGQGPNYVTIKDLQIQASLIGVNNYGHQGGGVLLGAASENLIQNVAFVNIDETYGIAVHIRDRNVVDEVAATARDADVDFGTTGGAANEKYALKFTASRTGVLRHVTVRLGITGAPAGTVEAYLYSNSAGPNAQIGSASGSTTINTISSAADGEDVDFEFEPAPATVAGTVYWLVLETTGYTYADGVTELRLRVDDGDGDVDTVSTYDAGWSFEGATNDAGYDLEVVVREGQGILNRLDRCMAYGAERAYAALQIEDDNQAVLSNCDFYTQNGLRGVNFQGLVYVNQSQFSCQATGRPIAINVAETSALGGITHWSQNYIEGGNYTNTSYFGGGFHTFEGNDLAIYVDSDPNAQLRFMHNRGPLFYMTTDATKRHEDLDYFIGGPGSYGLTFYGVDSAGVVDADALMGTAFELDALYDYVRWTFADNANYIYKLLAPGTYRFTVYAKSDGVSTADLGLNERLSAVDGDTRHFTLTADYRPYSIIVTLGLGDRGKSAVFVATKTSSTVTSTIHISHFTMEAVGEAEPLRRDLFAYNQEDSDGDGDRQSALWFYGKQSGGEQGALASVKAFHYGAADNELGRLVVSVNDGSDKFVPTDVITVDPGVVTIDGILNLDNTGLHILDTGGDHDLIIAPGTDLSADKTLTLTTGDSDRTITLSGNPTLDDWFDQAVKAASSPSFAGVTLGNEGLHILDTNSSHDLVIKAGSDLDADYILSFVTGNAARTITLSGDPTLDDWFDQAVKVASSPEFATVILGAATTLSDTIDDFDAAEAFSCDITGVSGNNPVIRRVQLYIYNDPGADQNIPCRLSFYNSDSKTEDELIIDFYINLSYTEINNGAGYAATDTAITVDDTSGLVKYDLVRFLGGTPENQRLTATPTATLLTVTQLAGAHADNTGVVRVAEITEMFQLVDADASNEIHVTLEFLEAPNADTDVAIIVEVQ